MSKPNFEALPTIPDLLVKNIPKDLILSIEDGLIAASTRAHVSARGMDPGHHAHALGQDRHFHLNEAFHRSLQLGGCSPSPIKGNGLVIGRSGIFELGRFTAREGYWQNARRAQTRRLLAQLNRALHPLIYGSLFDRYSEPRKAVVFFATGFSGSDSIEPTSVRLAVPDMEMKGWLYFERTSTFLLRYEPPVAAQEDGAQPKLKTDLPKTGSSSEKGGDKA